jgi:Cof subfamily protein (haloacid dehalogenase superfamily)
MEFSSFASLQALADIPVPPSRRVRSSVFRLAAIDLDGTLLGPDKQISAANAAAVGVLRELGLRVVLASGRRHESMARFAQQLGLRGPLISCQGALVKHAETGAVLYRQFVAADLAAEIVAQSAEEGGTLLYHHTDAIYVARRNCLTELFANRGHHRIVECGDLRRLDGETPQKIVWLDDPAQTTARLARVRKSYGGRLELLITSPEYLEFTALGVNKAAALDVVAKYYGIDPSETLAFGDGNNDIEMFRWAGVGVAMSHATPGARTVATFIAPPSDPSISLARAVAKLYGNALSSSKRINSTGIDKNWLGNGMKCGRRNNIHPVSR